MQTKRQSSDRSHLFSLEPGSFKGQNWQLINRQQPVIVLNEIRKCSLICHPQIVHKWSQWTERWILLSTTYSVDVSKFDMTSYIPLQQYSFLAQHGVSSSCSGRVSQKTQRFSDLGFKLTNLAPVPAKYVCQIFGTPYAADSMINP